MCGLLCRRMSVFKGRGAPENPAGRFEKIQPGAIEEELPDPRTVFLKDSSKSILSTNQSPDLGFDQSVNPYRGCEHGCAYCYARPTHEYLGYSAGVDFETKILVKEEAPELLRKALLSPRYEPKLIVMSGVTDCYQPVERRLGLTRRCVEVLAEFRNPVFIITKNALVTRDVDLFADLARDRAAGVLVSVTTLDADLCGVLEPRTSRPPARLRAMEILAAAGVPVGVNVAPIIPGLTDHEVPAILKAAKDAGASFAGYTSLRLPYGVGPLFEKWLEAHRPERKDKVLNRVRAMRGGKLNDSTFGSRMRGEGVMARQVGQLFDLAARKAGLSRKGWDLSTAAFRRPGEQQSLF